MKINIPKPCTENWQKMSPTEQGRFCQSCQKEVIDFSNKTDREILQILKNQTQKDSCGRFQTSQINRELKQISTTPFQKFSKYFVGFSAFFAGAFFLPNEAKSQDENPTIQTENLNERKWILQGKIVNEKTNQPISGANISVENSGIKTVSNSEGEFRLDLTEWNENADLVLLNISKKGFKSSLISFENRHYKGIAIFLEAENTEFQISDNQSETSHNVNQIQGKIISDYPEIDDPVIGANIFIMGTNKGTVTDIDGNYQLDISGFEDLENTKIQFSFIGLETKILSLSELIKPENNTIKLFEDTKELQGGFAYARPTQTVVGKIRGLWRRIFN